MILPRKRTISPFPGIIDRSSRQAQGLVGFWPLNESSGSAAYNLVGRVNGTYQNSPTNTLSMFGVGRTFNGSTQYIDVGNGSDLNITGSITISAWICLYVDKQYAGIVDRNYATSYYFGTALPGNRQLSFFYGGIESKSQTNAFILNKWSHVAISYNKTNQQTLFFVDGAYKGGTSGFAANPSGSNANTSIARQTLDIFYALPAGLADVRLYARALTQAELVDLYVNPLGIYKRQERFFGKSLSNIPYHLLFSKAS